MAKDSPTVFLVTGAASGIGRHLVGALDRRGDRVLATDVSAEGLERAAREERWNPERVRTRRLDVRSPEAWSEAVDEAVRVFGGLSVLLNVAGYLHPGRVVDATPDDVDRHLDINVKGVIHGMRTAGSLFVKQGRGHIVNIGSLASLAPVPGLSLYSCSKFAVRGVSLAAAQELAGTGVAVTVVMPDAVQTPMLDLQVDYPDAAMTFSGPRPLTVEEIAAVIFDDVLVHRPLEVTLPKGRGLVARAANTLPEVVARIGPLLAARGRRAQEKAKRRRPGG